MNARACVCMGTFFTEKRQINIIRACDAHEIQDWKKCWI